MKPIERVSIFIKYLGASISAFENKIGASTNAIQIAIKRNSNLKDETLINILNAYPSLNAKWLLQGLGDMLSNQKEIVNSTSHSTVPDIIQIYDLVDDLARCKGANNEELANRIKRMIVSFYSHYTKINERLVELTSLSKKVDDLLSNSD